ncbi:MAG: D-alanyl-D-alanine carboxypeptidase [Ruminococcaceae bacterium]|nr:D-alanyl-D-alanine carboxypeptidase [Oscillospiraceae bacterium]
MSNKPCFGRAFIKRSPVHALCFFMAIAILFQMTVFFSCIEISALTHGTGTSGTIPPFSHISASGSVWYNQSPSLPVALKGTSAQSAILINADTGEVLFRQNESARLPMASTTKIMTALIAVESLPVDTRVSVPPQAVGVEGSSIYLTEGEVLTLEDLLYALMLESANDAAVAIAMTVSGSIDDFAERMNRKAAELGLINTHFVNPHGLDDPAHYTTAHELAIITQAALKHDVLKTIMSTVRKTIPHNGEAGIRLLLNHNKLLRSYGGAMGVKTGFTKKSGRCLVSAACREGLTLIAVTLNAPNDWKDHTSMLDYGFSLYETIELCPVSAYEAPLWVVGGTSEYVMVKNTESLNLSLPKNRGTIRCYVELPRFIFAPVAQGQELGRLVFYEEIQGDEMKLLGELSLYAQYRIEAIEYSKSLLEKISDLLGF